MKNRQCYFPRTISELKDTVDQIIALQHSAIVAGARTSTVLSFAQYGKEADIIDLTCLAPAINLTDNGRVMVEGAVSWQELIDFLAFKGRTILTCPTERSALVLSAVATSATGEYAFGFGPVREQIKAVEFIDGKGNFHRLSSDQQITEILPSPAQAILIDYQQSYTFYHKYKNGPFPRLQVATDLMCAAEGQLGVITAVELETRKISATSIYFIQLPSWRQSSGPLLEIFAKVQQWRGKIISCEFIDSYAWKLAGQEQFARVDIVAVELFDEYFEQIYAQFFCSLEQVKLEDIYAIDSGRFHRLRYQVALGVNEYLSGQQMVKRGSDVQLLGENFAQLLSLYAKFANRGIDSILFGHLGDGHLHFNFLAAEPELIEVEQMLQELYDKTLRWQGSPFAEHGIGTIKLPYIKPFYGKVQYAMFKELKAYFDPQQLFFPAGFMSIESKS